jgi:hypothetical protein
MMSRILVPLLVGIAGSLVAGALPASAAPIGPHRPDAGIVAEQANWASRMDRSMRRGLKYTERHNRNTRRVSSNSNIDMPERPPSMQGRGQLPGGPRRN